MQTTTSASQRYKGMNTESQLTPIPSMSFSTMSKTCNSPKAVMTYTPPYKKDTPALPGCPPCSLVCHLKSRDHLSRPLVVMLQDARKLFDDLPLALRCTERVRASRRPFRRRARTTCALACASPRAVHLLIARYRAYREIMNAAPETTIVILCISSANMLY